jgi:hypothetical protein
MTTEGFFIALFRQIHDVMKDIPKHLHANLCPSEIVSWRTVCAEGRGEPTVPPYTPPSFPF